MSVYSENIVLLSKCFWGYLVAFCPTEFIEELWDQSFMSAVRLSCLNIRYPFLSVTFKHTRSKWAEYLCYLWKEAIHQGMLPSVLMLIDFYTNSTCLHRVAFIIEFVSFKCFLNLVKICLLWTFFSSVCGHNGSSVWICQICLCGLLDKPLIKGTVFQKHTSLSCHGS